MATEKEKERWIEAFLRLTPEEHTTLAGAYADYRGRGVCPKDMRDIEGTPIVFPLAYIDEGDKLVYLVPRRRVYLIAEKKIIYDWECTYEQMVGVLNRSNPSIMANFMKDMALIWGGVAL